MKTFKNFAGVLVISTLLGLVSPVAAQTVKKDTSSTTKPNGAGAGNGASQGAPGAATVSGTGTGTLADSNGSVASGSGVKKTVAVSNPDENTTASSGGHSNWGWLGLVGLLGLLGLRKNGEKV